MPRIELQKRVVLVLKIAEELLGNVLDIEGGLEPPCHIDNADLTLGVEFGKVEDHLVELAEEKVAGLTLEVQVVARDLLTVLPLHPVPEALCSLSVHKDQEVLVVELGDFLVDARACLGVRDGAIVRFDLQYDGPGQLGKVAAGESRFLDIDVEWRFADWTGPTKLFNEEPLKAELSEALPGAFDIQGHIASRSCGSLRPKEQMIRGS